MLSDRMKELFQDPKENYLIFRRGDVFYTEEDPAKEYTSLEDVFWTNQDREDCDFTLSSNVEWDDEWSTDPYLMLMMFGSEDLALPLDKWAENLTKPQKGRKSDSQRPLVLYDYYRAVEYVKAWRESDKSPEVSYNMLDSHPVFWYISANDHVLDIYSRVVHNQLVQRFWHMWSNGTFMMECGERGFSVHDVRLDTYGKSFDDCIVQTAELVDKYFDEYGNDRE